MPTHDPNVGIAFALVSGAGMCTALGAAIVFSPTLVKFASRKTLAGALGLSAGVMCYVSFVEILQKSNISFLDAGHSEDEAYMYSTLCFFAGVILMIALNYLVTFFLGGHHHHHMHDDGNNDTQPMSNDESTGAASHTHTHHTHTHTQKHHTHPAAEEVQAPACPCCSDDPAGDLEGVHQMAAQIHDYETRENREWEGQVALSQSGSERGDDSDGEDDEQNQAGTSTPEDDGGSDGNKENDDDAGPSQEDQEETDKLMRMSINTAVAIGLHNFPEGLATFVAALNDPRVGGVLAIAIAIHNIPEGLCVAMPIYYATGNRWKAFGWAVLSGASEPFAALLGWAVLANSFSDDMYAVLFGLVAGMMVIISVRELLPTAHRYDPEDTVVTYSFMVGMAIMAVSLVLFTL